MHQKIHHSQYLFTYATALKSGLENRHWLHFALFKGRRGQVKIVFMTHQDKLQKKIDADLTSNEFLGNAVVKVKVQTKNKYTFYLWCGVHINATNVFYFIFQDKRAYLFQMERIYGHFTWSMAYSLHPEFFWLG